MSLKNYTTNDLVKELKRREEDNKRPVPNENLYGPGVVPAEAVKALAAIIETMEVAIDCAIERGYLDDDTQQYLYETVIEQVYGSSFWKWEPS